MSLPAERHRSLTLLRGERDETASRADALVRRGAETAVWVGQDVPEDWLGRRVAGTTNAVRKLLGISASALVLDVHEQLNLDVLAQAQGWVLGGGRIIIRTGPDGLRALAPDPRFAAWPFGASDVRSAAIERVVIALEAVSETLDATWDPPASFGNSVEPTDEQLAAVDAVIECLRSPGSRLVLAADRGRGKSTVLGWAAAAFGEDLLVVAGEPRHARQLVEIAECEAVRVATPLQALAESPRCALVVEEAATLSVPVLRALVAHYSDHPVVFATTTHGYEGTGRGFSLRFVPWLRQRAEVVEPTLSLPVRWAAGDPVERAIFDALLLGAELGACSVELDQEIACRRLEPVELATDERLLRSVYALLVHAHYRTTPSDLRRLLDAPNLTVHAAFHGDDLLGVTWVAVEGGLPDAAVADLVSGRVRSRGHVLPDVLASHLGESVGGRLRIARSVRIATDPRVRRAGVASALVAHVHQFHDVDLFGTVFGGTPDLITFRRSVGYELVWVGASRGAHTGVPSICMLRPVSAEACALFDRLRGGLARDLPVQLDLLDSSAALALEPAFREAALRGLPAPNLDETTLADQVQAYANGPRTFESVAFSVDAFLRGADLGLLPADLRAIVEVRVLQRRSWADAMLAAEAPSLGWTMRGLRRAVKLLADG